MQSPSLATRTVGLIAIPLLVASMLIGIVPRPEAASAATCQNWTGVPPPSPGAWSVLNGVTTFPCRAWAVGWYDNGPASQTLILHWDGTAWARVPSPSPGRAPTGSTLNAVTATSSTNAWAVGTTYNGTASQTLVLHWDGKAWTRLASPNPGGVFRDNILNSVAATSSTNAWVVGYYDDGTVNRTLIERWNGTTWTKVSSPSPGPGNAHLRAVAATSSTDAWAVGVFSNGIRSRSLVVHWDGTSWTRLASPSPYSADFEGVAATSSTDAWAVGLYDDGYESNTLIAHWDGTSWTRAPAPSPGNAALRGVTAISSTNAWAVGEQSSETRAPPQTLILRWNGTSWKRVPSPNPGGLDNNHYLKAVDATSSTNVWAVGWYFDGTAGRTLALHCC